jgi:hypothetical protein
VLLLQHVASNACNNSQQQQQAEVMHNARGYLTLVLGTAGLAQIMLACTAFTVSSQGMQHHRSGANMHSLSLHTPCGGCRASSMLMARWEQAACRWQHMHSRCTRSGLNATNVPAVKAVLSRVSTALRCLLLDSKMQGKLSTLVHDHLHPCA